MELEKDRIYHMSELRILLEKQRKEKEQNKRETQVTTVINKTTLEDKDISDKNCIFLSKDRDTIINILDRKIMYRNNQLWCPDHGDKCIIRPINKNSHYPAYNCSMMSAIAAPFGMGCGKIITKGQRTPLFFYNFSSDIRKIITIAALIQFQQMTNDKIMKFGNNISYQNCMTIKASLSRAQLHDTRTLQILQNQWNLFKRYCHFHNLNYLKHLNKLVTETPFSKTNRGRKRLTVETAQKIFFNAPREKELLAHKDVTKMIKVAPIVQSVQPAIVQQITLNDLPISPAIRKAIVVLSAAIDNEYSAKIMRNEKEIELYKEDALKYRKMMEIMKG